MQQVPAFDTGSWNRREAASCIGEKKGDVQKAIGALGSRLGSGESGLSGRRAEMAAQLRSPGLGLGLQSELYQ